MIIEIDYYNLNKFVLFIYLNFTNAFVRIDEFIYIFHINEINVQCTLNPDVAYVFILSSY